MIFEMILLAIIGAIWLFAGYQIIKFLVPEIGLLTAVSLGAMLGEILYLFFVNVSSYAMPVFFSSRTILIGLLIVGVFFWILNRKNKTAQQQELKKPYLIFLIISVLIIVAFYGIILFFGEEANFDAYFHQPLASTIAEGNFPPRLPYNPEFSVQYHYGIDLLAASIMDIAGVMAWNAFNVIVLWNILWTFLIAFIAGYSLSDKNFLSGLLSAVLIFFGGSWKYLAKFLDIFGTISTEDFKSNLAQSYGIQLFHNPSAIAVPALLLSVYLIYLYILHSNRKKISNILFLLILSIIIGALALLAEEKFVILIAALLALSAFYVISKRHKNTNSMVYAYIIIAACIAIIIAATQGGVISDKILPADDQQINQEITQFKFRSNPGLAFWDNDYSTGFISIFDPKFIFFLLSQLGPIPLLLPFIIFYLNKFTTASKEQKFVFHLIITMTILSFSIPVFFEYPVSDVNFTRIFIIFKDMGNILFGAAIGILIQQINENKKRHYYIIAGFILIVSYIFAPISYNLSTIHSQSRTSAWGWNSLPPYAHSSDLIIAKEIKKIIPKNSKILTNNAISVPILWGRFAPFSESRKNIFHYRQEFVRSFPQPSPSDLSIMDIQYIYISPFREDTIHSKIQDFLVDGIDLRYIKNHPEWFQLVKIWTFDSQEYHLYKFIN